MKPYRPHENYVVPVYRQIFDQPIATIPWCDKPSSVLMRDDGVAYVACPNCALAGTFVEPDGSVWICVECKGRGRVEANLW